MSTSEANDDSGREPASPFTQTHWSVVLAAAQASSAEADAALESLCRTYWRPLYGYVRRKGYNPPDAQDLTQEFFARLLKNKSFAGADRQKGKFRTYLLGALNHFLADEWDKARAEKRGGRVEFISIDDTQFAESKYAGESALSLTPEQVYDRGWTLTVLERSMARLKADFTKTAKASPFELLKTFLTREAAPAEYETVAAQLETTSNHVAVSIHRMRHRYRELVRDEIAQTVGSDGDVDEELRALFQG